MRYKPKNAEGFWLIALSWRSFRDSEADKGTSREMLKDLRDLSEKSRNFNPPTTGEAREGQGGISPPTLQLWDARDTSKISVRELRVIFGSCFGCRG